MFFPIIGACVLGWVALSTWHSSCKDKEIYWGPKLLAFLFYAFLAGVSWSIGEALASGIAAEAFKRLYTWTGIPPPSMVIGLLFPIVILGVKRYRHGRLAMWKYWQKDLTDVAIAAAITWPLVYFYHVYRVVQGRLSNQATIASPHLKPPTGWNGLSDKPRTRSVVRTWVSIEPSLLRAISRQ
jgi:hypothetical protein